MDKNEHELSHDEWAKEIDRLKPHQFGELRLLADSMARVIQRHQLTALQERFKSLSAPIKD